MFINLFIFLIFLSLIYYFFYFSICNNNERKDSIVKNNEIKDNENKMKDIFSNIYNTNHWGKGSGMGSFKECTKDYLLFLKDFITKHNVKKIIDLGCGDWQMLRHFTFPSNVYYYGYDVVKNLVERHNTTYKNEHINFYYLNSIEDKMEDGDLIITKDVLQHWENKYVIFFLNNILSKYKYGIIVNDFEKNKENVDIKIGETRALDLEKPPFFYKDFSYYKDMMFCYNYKRIYIKE